jgi:hypothetical protein
MEAVANTNQKTAMICMDSKEDFVIISGEVSTISKKTLNLAVRF